MIAPLVIDSKLSKELAGIISRLKTDRMAPREILIVGCDIAGPTLASFLLLSDISAAQKPRITVLERESKGIAHLRGQNVDIRGAGVTVIRKLGLKAQIRACTTGEGGVQHVDAHNRVWLQHAVDKRARYRGRRATLRSSGAGCPSCAGRTASGSARKPSAKALGASSIYSAIISTISSRMTPRCMRTSPRAASREALTGWSRWFAEPDTEDGMARRRRRRGGQAEADRHACRLLQHPPRRTRHRVEWRQWFYAPGRRGIMLRPDGLGGGSTIFMYVVNDKDPKFIEVVTKRNGAIDAQKALLGGSTSRAPGGSATESSGR